MALNRLSGIEDSLTSKDAAEVLINYGIITSDYQLHLDRLNALILSLPAFERNKLIASFNILLSQNGQIGGLFGDIFNVIKQIFGGGQSATDQVQQLQAQLYQCQSQLMQNSQKSDISQYLPLLLIAGIGLFLILKKK